jgi:hypothetical protein
MLDDLFLMVCVHDVAYLLLLWIKWWSLPCMIISTHGQKKKSINNCISDIRWLRRPLVLRFNQNPMKVQLPEFHQFEVFAMIYVTEKNCSVSRVRALLTLDVF